MSRSQILSRSLSLFLASALGAQSTPAPDSVGQNWRYTSDGMSFRAEVVATRIEVPAGMAFLPDGRMLVADRKVGRIVAVDPRTGTKVIVKGVPAALGEGGAGMLDVALHPDYRANGWIYFSYSLDRPGGSTTVVDRARLRGDSLVDRAQIFEARPVIESNDHFGGRLLFHQGFLFVTLGDRTARDLAQYLGDHHGKIVRIRDGGGVPFDNPFVSRAGVSPEIWSYGHRNPQGLAIHPTTGELWEHEHGPRGGDEINIIRPGRNYGWPLISYGQEYYGVPIGEGLTRRDGLEQPLHYWVPSIAPSGMTFYTGDKFPAWLGNLFIGAMGRTHLNRLVIENGVVVKEERLLLDRKWRVRVVVQGPDGFLYIGVDGGMIVRIRPADR